MIERTKSELEYCVLLPGGEVYKDPRYGDGITTDLAQAQGLLKAVLEKGHSLGFDWYTFKPRIASRKRTVTVDISDWAQLPPT